MQIAGLIKDELEEMFDHIDEDGDRIMSFEEFARLMREMDHARTDTELRANFGFIDTNHDGRVSFEEFCDWIVR